jgi:hypothetical protein
LGGELSQDHHFFVIDVVVRDLESPLRVEGIIQPLNDGRSHPFENRSAVAPLRARPSPKVFMQSIESIAYVGGFFCALPGLER